MKLLGRPSALHAALLASSLSLASGAAYSQREPASPAPAPAPYVPPRSSYFPLPTLRFGFGSHIPLNAAAGEDSGFAFDLAAGVAAVPSRAGLMLLPELGYSYDGSDTRGGHFFTAGAAAMYGSVAAGVGVSSRFLAGDSHHQFGYGARNSLAFHLATTLMLEIGHQWVRANNEDRHELRVTISINPVSLIAGVLGLMAVFRGISIVGRTVDTAISGTVDLLLPSGQRPVPGLTPR
jgi:hypothetical protein